MLGLSSCKNDKANIQGKFKNTDLGNIVISTIREIPIDYKDYYYSYQTHVINENDSIYLYRENYFTNSCSVINWTSNKVVKRYEYEEEGPNSISRFTRAALLPIGKDSMLIGTLSGKIYLAENDSVLLTKNLEVDNIPLQIMATNSDLPQRINTTAFMSEYPFEYMGDDFYKHNILVSYNFKTNQFKKRNIFYPSKYYNKCFGNYATFTSFTLNNENKFVFSFPIDSNLYIYDPELDAVTDTIPNKKSKFIPELTPISTGSKCPHEDEEISLKSYYPAAFYTHIRYDKYKDVYYRIGLLPVEESEDKRFNMEMTYMRFVLKPIVIMVLDSEFNVIGEKRLPPKTYNFNDIFITEEGLWISNNNPENPSFDENILSFSLIEIER
jgi:hypothetical protein